MPYRKTSLRGKKEKRGQADIFPAGRGGGACTNVPKGGKRRKISYPSLTTSWRGEKKSDIGN